MDFEHHLEQRGLNSNIRCWIDWRMEKVVFPIYTATGYHIGHQNYFWREYKTNNNVGRYMTKVLPEYRQVAFWGVEYLGRPGPLFVVEGIWDAIRAINCGVSCIACLTNEIGKQGRKYMRVLAGDRPLVGILDNDANLAGDRLRKLVDFAFKVEYTKDLNEMTQRGAEFFLANCCEEIRCCSHQ